MAAISMHGFIPCMPLSFTGEVARGGPNHGAKTCRYNSSVYPSYIKLKKGLPPMMAPVATNDITSDILVTKGVV